MIVADIDGSLVSASLVPTGAPLTGKYAQIAYYAALGKTREEIAAAMGIPYGEVVRAALRKDIKILRKTSTAEYKERYSERAKSMFALYQRGYTLEQIGAMNGITRERVRQLMTKHLGVTGEDGGEKIKARKKAEVKAKEREARLLAKHGVSIEEYERITAIAEEMVRGGRGRYQTPFYAYRQQRGSAARRGIEWAISFGEWWAIWEASGKWAERGRGKYCMCRIADVGPYAAYNVYIDTASHNASAYQAMKHGRSGRRQAGIPPGIQVTSSGHFSVAGPGKLGTYRTLDEALEAKRLRRRTEAALIKHGSHVIDPRTGELIRSKNRSKAA